MMRRMLSATLKRRCFRAGNMNLRSQMHYREDNFCHQEVSILRTLKRYKSPSHWSWTNCQSAMEYEPFILHEPQARRRPGWTLFLNRLLSNFRRWSLSYWQLFINQLFHPPLIKGNSILLDRILIVPSIISKVDLYSSLKVYLLECLHHLPDSPVSSLRTWNRPRCSLRYQHDSNQIPFWRFQGLHRTYTRRRHTTSIHIETEEGSVWRCHFARIIKVTRGIYVGLSLRNLLAAIVP